MSVITIPPSRSDVGVATTTASVGRLVLRRRRCLLSRRGGIWRRLLGLLGRSEILFLAQLPLFLRSRVGNHWRRRNIIELRLRRLAFVSGQQALVGQAFFG